MSRFIIRTIVEIDGEERANLEHYSTESLEEDLYIIERLEEKFKETL